ncbi:hypothetical protein V1507DRAFT_453011 [Lipomyces tetrasporus]
MTTAAQFVDCVLSAAFVKLVSTPMSITKEEVCQHVFEKLKQVQPSDLPVPYAARSYANEIFSIFPEDVFPTEFEVNTHLQLLNIFRSLRCRISDTDGLFDVWNSYMRADMSKVFDKVDASNGYWPTAASEIRWKVYVARAVERYALWFNSYPAAGFNVRPRFLGGVPCSIDMGTLPPIDVLMVWHVHMLHPRAYWEDCIRTNRQGLFRSMAFPWLAISHVIRHKDDNPDSELIYDPSSDAQKDFQARTGCSFDNEDDNIVKHVQCTNCRKRHIQVDWHAAFHHGWAEEKFEKFCPECGAIITRDSLSALQFLDDFSLLSSNGVPMKGTLLDYLGVDDREQCSYPGFANEFVGKMFSMPKLTLESGEGIDVIRGKLKDMLGDKTKLVPNGFNGQIHRDNQFPLRRMLVRYQDNPTPFAVDLQAAVMRQGHFVDIMNALAYISSPFRKITVDRSIERLLKFLYLLRTNPGKCLAPPLDVDLAWHTFQLSPAAYMASCFVLTGTYVDHDDSIGSPALSDAHKLADKTWRSQFPSDPLGYDGCTCVFCESERQFTTSSRSSSASKKLLAKIAPADSRKRAQNIDEFYDMACTTARNNGARGVVRLQPPATGVKGERPVPRHPYLSFVPQGDPTASNVFQHSTAVDYAHAKCITILNPAGTLPKISRNRPMPGYGGAPICGAAM